MPNKPKKENDIFKSQKMLFLIIIKLYKTLQNIEIRSFCIPPPLSKGKTVKEASAVCRSFLDGVLISSNKTVYIQAGTELGQA